jgi:hypothetical protein
MAVKGSNQWVVKAHSQDKVHSHALGHTPSQVGKEINDQTPKRNLPPTILVWLGVPDDDTPISNKPYTGIPLERQSAFSEAGLELLRELQSLEESLGESLEESLGSAFIAKDKNDDGKFWVHQSLATMLLVAGQRNGPLRLGKVLNWNHLSEDDLDSLLSMEAEHDQKILVFVARNSYPSPGSMSIDAFYNKMEYIMAANDSIELYPSRDEFMFEEQKVGDIRTLDAIAAGSAYEFAWRPKTCFGVGPCQLAEPNFLDSQRMVLKRTFSAAGEHVLFVKPGDRSRLRCVMPPDAAARVEPSATPQQCRRCRTCAKRQLKCQEATECRNWFHQEYVEALPIYGELRTFIRAPTGTSRTGKIIATIHTKPGEEESTIWCQEFRADTLTFIEPDKRKDKARELSRFALYVYARLRSTENASRVFQSLHVGVRLDIGISELSNRGRWWVNEITRWCEADFFQFSCLPSPYTRISESFAAAWMDQLRRDFEGRRSKRQRRIISV